MLDHVKDMSQILVVSNDGVGLEFVVEPRDRSNRGPASPIDAVDSKRLGHFLKPLEKSKR